MLHHSMRVRFAVILGLGVALAGCNQTVKIKDGMLPNELLPYAQKFLGDYHGQIERRATGLTVSLDGNRLMVKSTDDIIAPVCQSKIGNLTKINYREEKDKTVSITSAVFDFDPSLCGNDIHGRQIEFRVSAQNPLTLDLSFLDHYELLWRCENHVGNPQPFPSPAYPSEHCWQEQYAFFQTGRMIHN